MFKRVFWNLNVLPDGPRRKLLGSHALVDPGQAQRLRRGGTPTLLVAYISAFMLLLRISSGLSRYAY